MARGPRLARSVGEGRVGAEITRRFDSADSRMRILSPTPAVRSRADIIPLSSYAPELRMTTDGHRPLLCATAECSRYRPDPFDPLDGEPSDTLDLHGFRATEAASHVTLYLTRIRKQSPGALVRNVHAYMADPFDPLDGEPTDTLDLHGFRAAEAASHVTLY